MNKMNINMKDKINLNKNLLKKLHLGKDNTELEEIKPTGHPEIDLALERFRATDDTVRAMFLSLGEYFDVVRKFGDSSGKVTQSLAGFFGSHAPSQESIAAFTTAHEKVDSEIVNRLLELADTHVMQPLNELVFQLDEVRKEIGVFREKQTGFDHYDRKVLKLEEDKRKKGSDSKLPKQKEQEKLARNHSKLATIREERDSHAAALMNQLNHMESCKIEKVNPVYTAVFQFQQEMYKQSMKALNFELPAIDTTVARPPPVTLRQTQPTAPPPPPMPTGNQYPYQQPRTSFSNDAATAPPPVQPRQYSYSANNPGPATTTATFATSQPQSYSQAAPTPFAQEHNPYATSAPPVEIPRRPSITRRPPAPIPGTAPAVGRQAPQPPQLKPRPGRKNDGELVDKWFGN